MSKELGILNVLCIVAAIGFLALVILSALTSGDFFTTDNLFIIVFSLLMALLFAINPLLYLYSEGRLPIPGRSKSISAPANQSAPLLDAKGRAVPPDVKAIMARMGPQKGT